MDRRRFLLTSLATALVTRGLAEAQESEDKAHNLTIPRRSGYRRTG